MQLPRRKRSGSPSIVVREEFREECSRSQKSLSSRTIRNRTENEAESDRPGRLSTEPAKRFCSLKNCKELRMTLPKPCKFHRRFSPNKRVSSMTWEFFTDDSFDDGEQYELIALGEQIVHYAMTDISPKIEFKGTRSW